MKPTWYPFVKYMSRNLINKPNCYKNPLNPSCTDLFVITVIRNGEIRKYGLYCSYFYLNKVKKSATDEKDYCKFSLCVMVCIATTYQ